MKIAVVSWLKGKSIPVTGYGGIERMVETMCSAFTYDYHEVHLIAPPPSNLYMCHMHHCSEMQSVEAILDSIQPDIVWDNTCWDTKSPARTTKWPCVSTTHVNHAVGWNKNVIYLSQSQKRSHEEQLGKSNTDNPVIFVPANPALQPKGRKRGDYLLFLGSVAPWKGVLEAADFAQDLGRGLLVAGPAWGEYAETVSKRPNVRMLGEVDGDYKEQLLEEAYAVTCLHNDGGIDWKEPGCGVVMEAGAFGTPVFASMNGCLPELVVNGANGWKAKDQKTLMDIYANFPVSYEGVKSFTDYHFGVEKIVKQYINIFEEIINGKTYGNSEHRSAKSRN